MSVIDASVWISAILKSDSNHEISDRWLQAQVKSGRVIVVPAILHAEVAGPIARRTGNVQMAKDALDFVNRIPGLRVISLDRTLGRRAATIAAEHKVRGADAVYIAVAEQFRMTLFTWDKQQRERGLALVDAKEPELPQAEDASE